MTGEEMLNTLTKAKKEHPFLPIKIMVRGYPSDDGLSWALANPSMISIDSYWHDTERGRMWLMADNEDELFDLYCDEYYRGSGEDVEESFSAWYESLPWTRAVIVWID